ncbi:HAMP domain-containing sensor histidine kinase [Devosia sp. 2618]|uniref:sensor histidine kinase n=1 Tax=Devosia sp. 2618 TaxID=3156454 RepID=UPI0033915B05
MSWSKISLILANLICLFALMGASVWVLYSDDQNQAQILRLQAQLESTLVLGQATGQYGSELAQVLMLGREQQNDLRAARLAVERAFIRLSATARAQAVAASSNSQTRDSIKDIENARRMLELYHSIDLSASRAIVLNRDQRTVEAHQVYEREVDFRLSREFEALLDDAESDIYARIDAARAENHSKREQILIVWGIAALASIVMWLLTTRTLLRPTDRASHPLTQALEKSAEELRETNRRLRETDAKRSQFLADVSHELRTPLTILRGEADVALLPNAAAGEQRQSLERIQEQAADMGQLLDDLISFARSGEEQPLQLAPIMLDDLLAASMQEAEALAEPREVALDLKLPEGTVWVNADMRRLKQALLIGLDNAINHSPPGTTITGSLAVTQAGAEVQIQDQGPGITEQDQPHVFDRFYRGRDGRASSFGLGIGLAIAKSIVDQHLGTITLTNHAGGGAVLTIVLPKWDGATQ